MKNGPTPKTHEGRRHRVVYLVLGLVLGAPLWACFPPGMFMPPSPADAAASTDMAMVEQVAASKAAAAAAPGDPRAAVSYAQTLYAAYEAGTVERGALAGESMVPDVLSSLDAAATAHPDQAWSTHAAKGMLLLRVGRREQGLQALEASMAATPNTQALALLIPAYAADRRHDEIDAHCAATLATAHDNNGRFAVLEVCATARPGMNAADALPWASEADVALYEQQWAIEQARAEAERTELEARRERERAETQAAFDQSAAVQAGQRGNGNTPPAGPQRASVTLKNNCRERVRVFFGDKPKYGSGTYSWISSNSVSSYSMDAGDMLWIVDEHDNGLSSTSAPPGSSRIEILESCTGFVIR